MKNLFVLALGTTFLLLGGALGVVLLHSLPIDLHHTINMVLALLALSLLIMAAMVPKSDKASVQPFTMEPIMMRVPIMEGARFVEFLVKPNGQKVVMQYMSRFKLAAV